MNPESFMPSLAPLVTPILASSLAVFSGEPDSFCAIGASFATLIAYADARKNNIPLWDLVMKITVTFFGGVVLPKLLCDAGLLPKLSFGMLKGGDDMIWQGWAITGFLVGTFSWGAYKAVVSAGNKFIQSQSKITK